MNRSQTRTLAMLEIALDIAEAGKGRAHLESGRAERRNDMALALELSMAARTYGSAADSIREQIEALYEPCTDHACDPCRDADIADDDSAVRAGQET